MKLEMLHDASRAGLYFLPANSYTDFTTALAGQNVTTYRASLQTCKDATEALDELGIACQLPVWYGANLDALHDCLGDPDWLDGQTVVLMIRGLDTLRTRHASFVDTLIEVLNSAAESRSAAGGPLWVLLDNPTDGVPLMPLA